MLEHIDITNFRCLKKVAVPLRPLTVLIGPNDSGKSSFLHAVRHLSGRRDFVLSDCWRMGSPDKTTLIGTAGRRTIRVRSSGRPDIAVAENPLYPSELHAVPASGVLMCSQGLPDQTGPPPIGPGGENVPALLDYLLRRDRKRFFAFVEAMRPLVPGFEDIDIATPDSGTRRIDLVIENGLRLDAAHASAGLRLLIFFLALAYHPSPPKVILLEEPENGVHPRRLADVMRILREVTQGKHGGHAAQVILTTHSPYLLDHVNLDTDQVLVFRRNEDGSRSAEPVDAERLKTFLDEFMLGEVWYNEQEEGLVSKGA